MSYVLFRMVMLPMTLGDPLPAQFLHFASPYASSKLVVADFKFDVQVESASHSLRTTVSDRGVVGSCDPLKFLGLQSHYWNS